MSPRWSKVIRDLFSNKSRTVLVILAISVGVFAFGSVFIAQETLLKNIDSQYRDSKAATISIYLADFDSSLVNWVKSQSGVSEASGVSVQDVKLIKPNGKKEMLSLTAVPDYRDMKLNLLKPQKGEWPPGKGEIVLERNSLTAGKLQIGDSATIEINEGNTKNLYISGSVYDNSGFPYMFTNQMSGFVAWDTLAYLGFPKRFNKLDIATSPEIKTLDDAEKFTFNLTEELRQRGVEVRGTFVLKPNQHWATDNSKAFTTILSVIGVFSLVLSGFLVVNTISALIAQQKKQVGIMKAIGASGKQIMSLYLGLVSIYSLLALIIALPVGLGLGYVFLKMVCDFLNLDIKFYYLPKSVFLLELAAALLVPLIAAVIPIFQGTKASIRSAISDFQVTAKAGRIERLLAKIGSLPRPLLISLRNVFRKKGRLALTLGTLSTAGALFMAVLNVQAGMYREMGRILSMFDFEVSLSLNGDYNVEGITNRIKEIKNVTEIEGRTGVGARRIKSDGTKGSAFMISGLPPDTAFSHPVLLSGRWLINSDKEQIVLSSPLIRDNPDLTVGSNIKVQINNEKHDFEIVGSIAMAGDQKMAFANFSSVAALKDKPGLASSYMIKTSPGDKDTQDSVADEIEERLKRAGIGLAAKETKEQIYSSASSQFNFMVFFLLAMAVMVAIVGGLGLAGTMSLNVMERTREIGIMRSIGANDAIIRKLVLTEGFAVGLISWLLAIPFSIPLTYGFCYAIGNAFFDRTLVFVIVPIGIVIWLAIVFVIAVIASIIPARRAAKMGISETLSYE